jgi:glycosyltransferase involved in cell wall biosynthesis
LGQPTALSYDPRFRYPGYIAEIESIVNYYRAADVLLHAANADNFPLTVLEAMACGTPVIATGVCGISEQISDGLTGFLVPRQDADAMAERVFLLMRNRAACLQMGIRAKQRVDELYSLSTQSDAYLEWFHELIEE